MLLLLWGGGEEVETDPVVAAATETDHVVAAAVGGGGDTLPLTLPKSCMPMTAKMKMMMQRTNVRLESAPTVFIMMVRMSFKDFQDLASLNTLQIKIVQYC